MRFMLKFHGFENNKFIISYNRGMSTAVVRTFMSKCKEDISCQFIKTRPTEISNAGDGTEMVVQMVATLCALQRKLLEYPSSCRAANPNE
nr:hypothetical protein [Tanacetum cinerariifolium]